MEGVPLLGPALLEFLHSLHETDGGSLQPPPSVRRVLASKACRRSVMFGTPLSLANSQRVLSGLARCELPFQCAHGRPTLAPLAWIEALPKPR